MPMLRLACAVSETGRKPSTLYQDIRAGLFVAPVKVGQRSSAWPSEEVAAIIAARAAGNTDDEIRALVVRLHAARKEAA
jgi:prophage regulatory protein